MALALVAVVAGCGGSVAPAAAALDGDPVALPETPLAVETLPGKLTSAWPIAAARGSDAWLLPWSDADGVYARRVGDDGARDDRFVDGGTIVGAAPLSDGFALVVAGAGEARVHFLRDDGSDRVVRAPVDGRAVPGVASDGTTVVFATIVGGDIAIEQPTPIDATLVVATPDGARLIALGRVNEAPSVWGDARGFVVGGTLLVDAAGDVGPAPGRQVRDARVFRKPIAAGTQPTSDSISLGPPSGDGWLTVDGLVGWAGRDGRGARLELVGAAGRALQDVGDDLTPGARRPLPSTTRGDGGQSWVAAATGEHVVWAATQKNDPLFAILDARDMRPTHLLHVHDASSRTTIVSPGPGSVLIAWVEGRSIVHYAVNAW